MVFKINISDKGKTYKAETENEVLIGKKIGETINGADVSADLTGYELEITGTSDEAGFPGFKGNEGSGFHRKLLTRGPGMKNTQKGLRLRKTIRGEEISIKTHQINTKVLKQGSKNFEDLIKPTEGEANKEAPTTEAPAPTEKPAEKKKE